MKEKELEEMGIDEYFDNGGDMTPFIVPGSEYHPNQLDDTRKVNVTMPNWMVMQLDAVAKHLAVSRNAIINMWIAERLSEYQFKNVSA